MPGIGTPSLDQLQVFLTVVETGSFAAAGRRLSRATSAVSYTIANLERPRSRSELRPWRPARGGLSNH